MCVGYNQKMQAPDMANPLLKAIDLDDEDTVIGLVQRGEVTVNAELSLPGWRRFTLLHWAVQRGHVRAVSVLLERGASIDVTDASGDTVLHHAAHYRRTCAVALLLSDVSRVVRIVNRRNVDGDAPLHVAADSHALHVARHLLFAGADPNLQNAAGDTPLHVASRCGNPFLIKLLLSCDPIDVSIKNKDGNTALHLAVCSAKPYCSEAFLRMRNPRLDARNNSRFTPLHLVSLNLNKKQDAEVCKRTVELLIREGADANARCENGCSPLHFAAKSGNTAAIKALLSSDFNDSSEEQTSPPPVTQQQDQSKSDLRAEYVTWVHQVLKDVPEMDDELPPNKKDWLLDQRARSPEARLNARNKDGDTPLHLAAMHGHRTAAGTLLELGAVVNVLNRSFDAPLDLAFRTKHDSVGALLIKKGAELSSKLTQELVELATNEVGKLAKGLIPYPKYWPDVDDTSLLHLTAIAGRPKLLEALLDTGTFSHDANTRNEWRQTPLHCAAIAGKTSVVFSLISRPELRANAEDRSGKTALQYAVECKHSEIEKLLLERADVKETMDRMYRDRQVYVDAANAILVGAALIGGVTFAGWLQPPMGYFNGYVDIDVLSIRVFWAFNSLSFCFAMSTVLAAAGAVLPRPDLYIATIVQEVRRILALASLLLVLATQCVLAAFAAAGFAVLPASRKPGPYIMGGTVALGATCALLLISWFINKLWAMVPRWCTSSWRHVLLLPLLPFMKYHHFAAPSSRTACRADSEKATIWRGLSTSSSSSSSSTSL